MNIRILPGNLANMIAAGEVVQRPASVVKELVENSVDAGASKVSVIIQDAGRTLIQIIDDGCGMSQEEAVLCFERHATSKLSSVEDLHNILTFGFRGEALASIAAVAQVTLRTRREEDQIGCEVEMAASECHSVEEVSCPKGSNISVRDLFYNVPARRKFLKSDNVEFKHIVSEFTKVVLTRPDVGFSLVHNGKDIYSLKPAKSLKFRIQDLLGGQVAQEVLDISMDTDIVRIGGYIGRPDQAKKGLGNQYFFVNGRYFRSPYLHKAVMKAYENLMPADLTPSYFIYLEVSPNSVDVNVSPTKSEIKFEDDTLIFQTLVACLREALARQSFDTGIDFETSGAPDIPVFSNNFMQLHGDKEPQVGMDLGFNPFENDGFPSEVDVFNKPSGGEAYADPFGEFSKGGEFSGEGRGGHFGSSGAGFNPGSYVSKDESYGRLFEDRAMVSSNALVLQGRFVLANVKSGLMVINIRRARERILFDRFLAALSSDATVSQVAMFPETIKIGVENVLLIEESAAMLSKLGFEIRPFGKDSVVVDAMPEGFHPSKNDTASVIDYLVDALKERVCGIQVTMHANLAEKFAKAGASTDEPLNSPVQAQRLIDTLFACSNAEFTASGKRIMTIIPIEEIERKF